MAIRVDPGDVPGMNLTPMIDIVFQLVTFFMLTLDLSSKELAPLDLPRARHGVEDPPSTAKGERRLVFNVLATGDVQVKGVTYSLSAVDPAVQARSLAAMRDAVASIVRLRPRLPDGTTDLDVFIRADRSSAWRKVQWVLQTLGDPTIAAWRVTFSVEAPMGDAAARGGR